MISGTVTTTFDALVPLTLVNEDGIQRDIDAVIDTGFSGWLSLPLDLIDEMEFSWRHLAWVILADDSEAPCDVYDGAVFWNENTRRIPVDCGGQTPLIGMRLLENHMLQVMVTPNGSVTIDAMK